MKPLALNLSQMKKVAGDDRSSTFLHPSGHKMVIAHQGVSALQRKQLEKMPVHKYADGGGVQGVSEESERLEQQGLKPAPPPEPARDITPPVMDSSAGVGAPSSAERVPAAAAAPDEDEETPQPAPAAAPTADAPLPGQLPPASGNFQKAYDQGQQAISEQQKINAATAKANADIQSQDLLDRQSLQQSYQGNMTDFLGQQKQFMKDYAAEHIDPKHYVENMSAGDKISTGIGLLLGGFSTPFTHQGNPALEFLNKQIDRDIAAQQARQDQQKTLIGANQALFHDQTMALNQTRVNMNDIYDHKIQLAASKLGTPQAKAQADMAHAKFAIENQALLQQNAVRGTVMARLQQGGQGLTAIDLSHAGFIPQEHAIKEQASIDAQKTAIAKTIELYNTLDKEQSAVNLLNPQSSRRVAAANAELVNAVMNASASKRLTHESVQQEIAPLQLLTTDDKETRNTKLQGVLNIIQRHADPTPYMSQIAPRSLPQYNQTSVGSNEGKTVVNQKTGQRAVIRNGKPVPIGG